MGSTIAGHSKGTSARPSRSTSDSATTADIAITITAAIMAGVRSAAGQGMEEGTIAVAGDTDVAAAGTEQPQTESCPASSSPNPSASTLLQ